MKIVIAGAGAIGGYIGARLARAGADVVLHARGAHLHAMQTRGLRVTSEEGDFEVRPQTTGDLSSIGTADVVFLGVKAVEYEHKFAVGHVPGVNFHSDSPWAAQQQIFFSLYFTMTGLHALHMVIGVGIMLVILWMSMKGRFDAHYYNPVEMAGLYWHFVDLVWIYLFPLLYLVERHP